MQLVVIIIIIIIIVVVVLIIIIIIIIIIITIGISGHLGKHLHMVLCNIKLSLYKKQSVDLILILFSGHESYAVLSCSDIMV